MAGQFFGGSLAHMAYAQTKEKAGQGGVLGLLQRLHNIVCRLFGHALQTGKGTQAKSVQVWQRADDASVHQLLHQFVA